MSLLMKSRHALAGLALCAVALSACRKPAIESYRVAKDPEPAAAKPDGAAPAPMAPQMPTPVAPAAPAGQGAMANTPVATADGASLTWTAPAGWTSKTGSAMRKATYVIKSEGAPGEAELAVTAFPGDVGGELANVNRWRGQVHLQPVGAAELEKGITRTEANGLKIAIVELASPGDGAQRILGAMVPHAGATWFFKLSGPDALVAKEKPAFLAFIATVKPAATAP